MPANKYALLRYRIIDRCLTNKYKPFPSKEELRLACEEKLYGSQGQNISESTIEKDIWAMRNESDLGFYAPIKYDKIKQGYFYEDADYSINDVPLREEEVTALQFAANTLYQFKGVGLFNQFESAIEKIMSKVAIGSEVQEKDEHVIQFESPTGDNGAAHLGILLEAIRQKLKVRVTYQKFTADKPRNYVLNPLLLKEYRNRWYLIAFSDDKKMIQSFSLDRLRTIEVSADHFSPPAGFDPDLYFSHSIGITAFVGKPETVRFALNEISARYIETQPIHQTQKKLKTTGEWTEFEIKVLVTEELIMHFLSLGAQLKVLSPETLKTEIKNRLSQNLKHY
jgi:predicted DNA-binding transcriptional regulator YafY